MEEMKFAAGSVPVAVAARVYGKDASWIRAGIVWESDQRRKACNKIGRDERKVRAHQLLYFLETFMGRDRLFMEGGKKIDVGTAKPFREIAVRTPDSVKALAGRIFWLASRTLK